MTDEEHLGALTGYPNVVNYDLPLRQRYFAVKRYYREIPVEPKKQLDILLKDEVAKEYLGEYYQTLVGVLEAQMVKCRDMSLLTWFRTVFLPGAADQTLAMLFFLYDKNYGDRELSKEEWDFIEEETARLKKLKVRRDI